MRIVAELFVHESLVLSTWNSPLFLCSLSVVSPRFSKNGQDTIEEIRKGRRQEGRIQEVQEARGDVLLVHLQGPQAGPPRHWNLQEGEFILRSRAARARSHFDLE